MKKLILLSTGLLVLMLLSSCSNDCESQVSAATKQYQTAIQYTGGDTQAIQKIASEYNTKVNQIYSECR